MTLNSVRRSDVPVDVEEVIRAIGRLRCREPLGVRAMVCGRPVVVVAGHEVDVALIAARVGINAHWALLWSVSHKDAP